MNKLMYKKLLIVIVCLSFGINLNAQIDVSEFKEDLNDRDAVLLPFKRDGETWALIKISTGLTCAGFNSFDAGQAGKGELDCKDGHVWVYLPPGAMKLSIYHDAGSKENYIFPATLKAGTVYLMTLSGKQWVVNEDLVDEQYFTVRCSIPGATIQFDNKEELTFPFVDGFHRESLKYGKHTFVVKAPMYHEERVPVTITDKKLDDVTITLNPKFGTLIINTDPQGADIVITGTGGKPQTAKSPFKDTQWTSGTYKVDVQKPMYKPTSRPVTVTDGQTTTETIVLPRNFATIELVSEQGGTIFVDDESKGVGTWKGDLTTGNHRVTVRKKSHGERKQSITVTAGKDEKVTLLELVPMYGILGINITNSAIISAKVYIDGVEHRETAPHAGIKNIPTEEHTIRLVPDNAEYLDFEQTVEIKEGKITKLDATFREKEKFATLRITSTPPSFVSIDGNYIGKTPTAKDNLPLGEKKVSFRAEGYEGLQKTIILKAGNNHIDGILKKVKVKEEIKPLLWVGYEFSKTAPLELTIGGCKQWGGYFRVKNDIEISTGTHSSTKTASDGSETKSEWRNLIVEEAEFSKINFDERVCQRFAVTGGVMARLFSWCYLYGGVGYGEYGVAYELTEDIQVDSSGKKTIPYYCPDYQKGLDVEGGMMIKVKQIDKKHVSILLSVGYNTLLFTGSKQRFSDVSVGLGCMIDLSYK